MPPINTRAFLERRNALWQVLRQHSPDEPNADVQVFEQTLNDLSELIGWSRPRILAGLGFDAADDSAADAAINP